MIRSCTPDEVREVVSHMEYPAPPTCNSVAMFNEEGQVQTAVLYDYWTPNSVNAHIWSRTPKGLFSPGFIREIFVYPFLTCGRGLLIGVTPADCEASLRFSDALGFTEKYRIKDGWSVGTDMVIKEMRREECRWIRSKAA